MQHSTELEPAPTPALPLLLLFLLLVIAVVVSAYRQHPTQTASALIFSFISIARFTYNSIIHSPFNIKCQLSSSNSIKLPFACDTLFVAVEERSPAAFCAAKSVTMTHDAVKIFKGQCMVARCSVYILKNAFNFVMILLNFHNYFLCLDLFSFV